MTTERPNPVRAEEWIVEVPREQDEPTSRFTRLRGGSHRSLGLPRVPDYTRDAEPGVEPADPTSLPLFTATPTHGDGNAPEDPGPLRALIPDPIGVDHRKGGGVVDWETVAQFRTRRPPG